MKIQKNIILALYTTFKIGGPTKYFTIVENNKDLIEAVEFAKSKKLPFFILGGGSNILASDKGFNGLVILINNKQVKVNKNVIKAEAGVKLADLVKISIDNNLTGLEWAIGIPGTIGGAVNVNASAFGSDISRLVKNIEKKNNTILLVELELKNGNKKESQQMIKKYSEYRKERQPLEYPSAGCIFKNPINQRAGYLIDQASLKRKQIGQAQISEKHANFIINLDKAKSKDVKALIKLIKETVKNKFDIELEEEIQYLG